MYISGHHMKKWVKNQSQMNDEEYIHSINIGQMLKFQKREGNGMFFLQNLSSASEINTKRVEN